MVMMSSFWSWLYSGFLTILYVNILFCDRVTSGGLVDYETVTQLVDDNYGNVTTPAFVVNGMDPHDVSNFTNDSFIGNSINTFHSTSTNTKELFNQQVSNGLMNDLEMFGQFMVLQRKACPYVPLCTIQDGQQLFSTQLLDGVECCHFCSCKDDCIEYVNCCPDYFLSKHINTTFTDTNELVTFLKAENYTHILERNTLETKHDYIMHGTSDDCVKAQLLPIHKMTPHGNDYKLITKCLPTYPSDITRGICEDYSSSVSSLNLTDYLPVHSSSISYKNIHCLICNGLSSAESLDWTVIIKCSSYYFNALPYFEHVIDMTRFFLDRDKTSSPECNIVFEPSSKYNVERCIFANTDSCFRKPKNQTEAEWNTLVRICERFTLPVDKIHRALNTFKNIACFFCNEDSDFNEGCMDYYKGVIDYSRRVSSSFIKSGVSQTGGTLDQIFDETGACSRGYIQDRNRVCRKVLCPRGLFVFGGRCVPMVTTATNLSYRCIFNISILPRNADLQNIDPSLIGGSIQKLALRVLNQVLIRQSVGYALFQIPGNLHYLLYVVLYNQNRTEGLLDIPNTFSQLNEQLSKGNITASGTTTLRLRSDIFSNVYIREMGPYAMYDSKNKRYLSKVGIRKPSIVTPIMSITRANYCYRVKLTEENLTKLDYLEVRYSNDKVPLEDVELCSRDGKPIVCIGQTGLFVSSPEEELKGTKGINNKEIDVQEIAFEKGVYPLVVLAGLALFIAIVRIIIRSSKYLDNETSE